VPNVAVTKVRLQRAGVVAGIGEGEPASVAEIEKWWPIMKAANVRAE
jgi:hypothetical protein